MGFEQSNGLGYGLGYPLILAEFFMYGCTTVAQYPSYRLVKTTATIFYAPGHEQQGSVYVAAAESEVNS